MDKILDKKSGEEIKKHMNNCYLNNIISRKGSININNIFDKNNIVSYFNVNIKNFTSFAGSYYFNGKDPLVNTSLEYLKNNKLNFKESYLYKYYEKFQPKTYGELYELSSKNKLHKIKSTSYFHPWIHDKPTNIFRAGLFGPKDITNVMHRSIRILNLIKNIKKYGYLPTKGDIVEGYILLNKEGDYRFLITAGHHRVAVLTAMYMNGNKIYESIPVKYDDKRVNIRVVKEEKVDEWPGVKSNWLKREDAIEMFNKYFN